MGHCQDLLSKHRESIAYVFFGGLTTLVSWASYRIFVWMALDLNLSNILSWVCGVLFAFIVNKWFVFNSRSVEKKIVVHEAVYFFGSRLFTGIVGSWMTFPTLLWIGLDMEFVGTEGFVAKMISSCIEIVLNWVLSKYYVFRNAGQN